MPEWLLPPDSNSAVRFAAWTTVAVLFLVVTLFLYTLGLRCATLLGERRREKLNREWRGVLAASLLSEEQARCIPLPPRARNQRLNLLEAWNRARDSVRGSAADNLIVLGARIDLVRIAMRLLRKRALRSKLLAVQTLGHMRDAGAWQRLVELLNSENMALSVTAAAALADIDRERAALLLVPMITRRRDWPRTRVSRILVSIGSGLVSEPLYRAVRSGDDSERVYLLQFAELAEYDIIDALATELVLESRDPDVLSSALKLVSGRSDIRRVLTLAEHEVSYVRMQVARLLGRIGQPDHVPVLEKLLNDREWWVRYRAAQAITSLPFLGPNALRQLRRRQADEYARDILQQAYSEVGIA